MDKITHCVITAQPALPASPATRQQTSPKWYAVLVLLPVKQFTEFYLLCKTKTYFTSTDNYFTKNYPRSKCQTG